MNQSISDRLVLLARCSILRSLDEAILCFVLECEPYTAQEILSSPEVEQSATGYRLRTDVASSAAARLQADQGATSTTLHQRAFLFYLARLRQGPPRQHSLDDEDECIYHLNALFVPLLTQRQWQTMRRYALRVLRARPQRPEHRLRLHMFLGYAAVQLHRYAYAERVLGKLLAQQNLVGDVHIRALKALADSAWFRSHYGEALTRYEQLYQAALAAGDTIYQGLALLNRAAVLHELQVYDQALQDCEQSLLLFRAEGDQTREAHALYHAALFTLYMGRWDDARRYVAQARQQFERMGMQIYNGFIFWCEGLLAQIFGDEPASEASYLQCLAIAESPQDEQPLLALDSCVYLGILYHSAGRYHLALQYYQRALSYARRLDRQHQICLIHFRLGQIYERLGRSGRAFLAYRSAIRGVESMGRDTAREDVKISLLGTTQQIFEAMVLLCIQFFERSKTFTWIERAFSYVEQARSRAFLDSLARKNADDHNTPMRVIRSVELAEVQDSLPEDSLVLEYFTTGVLPRGEYMIANIPATNQKLRTMFSLPGKIIAFAISRERCEIFMPTLDPNRLRPQIGDSYPGRHLLLGHMPLTLYKQLIEPATAMLEAKQLLYIIPHGPLHYIPFAALRTSAETHLLDLVPEQSTAGLAIAQATSATILVRRSLKRPLGQGTQVLTIGYNDPQGEQPLRFAEAEAEHIGRLLGGEVLIGPQPKREDLRRHGERLSQVHIAGHALFTAHDPMGSWLLLGEGDHLSARDIIDQLRLSADLVTLSSCTSGLSHVVPGDELLGLPRALLLAGVPTVVCSRWEAIDIVTLLIMDRFYTELRHCSAAVALRNAQIAIRDLSFEQLEHIFYSWHAQGGRLAEAIGDPQVLLRELASISRQAPSAGDTPRSVVAPEAINSAVEYAEPIFQPDPQARPFAMPVLWASFMVIGRG